MAEDVVLEVAEVVEVAVVEDEADDSDITCAQQIVKIQIFLLSMGQFVAFFEDAVNLIRI